jgi:hypothetical protein
MMTIPIIERALFGATQVMVQVVRPMAPYFDRSEYLRS